MKMKVGWKRTAVNGVMLLILGAWILVGCSPIPQVVSPTAVEPTLTVEEQEIANWLGTNAIPLVTVYPEAGYEDLMPLKEIIGDARIVALGEGTHGTQEFITVRHRMIRFLVEEMGFNILAVEGDWGPAKAVNEYIQGGDGDARQTLLDMHSWVIGTEEMSELIEWMHDYNRQTEDSVRLSFYGLDIYSPHESMQHVIREMQNIDPEAVNDTSTAYACFPDAYWDIFDTYLNRSNEEKRSCLDSVRSVYDQIANSVRYKEALSQKAYAALLQEARVAVQGVEVYVEGVGSGSDTRDQDMAENATWLLRQAGPDAKIILWAHNGHVQKRSLTSMGGFLNQAFGDGIVVFGSTFYEGRFTAVRFDDKSLAQFTAARAPMFSYEYYFNLAGIPNFLLDVRDANGDPQIINWLEGPRGFRAIGCCAWWPGDIPNRMFHMEELRKAFDVIVYIHTTSPSHPLMLSQQ